MNVHIQHAVDGYSVEWFDKGRTGRDYEATVLGAIARVSQLLRGDAVVEETGVDWNRHEPTTPHVMVYTQESGTQPPARYDADDARVGFGGALELFLGEKEVAIFAPGTWRKALSQ